MGLLLRDGIEQAVVRHGLERFVRVIGRPCCLAYATLGRDGLPSQAFRSLFLQETIRCGVLAPSLVVSYCHGPGDIAVAVDAVDGALAVYRKALEDGVGAYLHGRPSQVVYRRFNAPETA
jgi:glutamate-1-semialdehyde 2,1-aminomutase